VAVRLSVCHKPVCIETTKDQAGFGIEASFYCAGDLTVFKMAAIRHHGFVKFKLF